MTERVPGPRFFFFLIAAVLGAAGILAAGHPELRWPLDLPRRLSGTLGETRGFSLHMGIDLKTDGLTGYPVHAAGGGVLSRLTSSPGGYGNALFLAHDGGLTTVYAHLDRFDEKKYPLNALAALASVLYTPDPVDMRFTGGDFHFGRGEIIAYTGESGSGLPHLHHEVRGASGFINPLRFFHVPDRRAPVIDALYLCVERDGSTLWERRVEVKKRWNRYVPEETPLSFPGGGRPYIKVSCYDRVNADNSVGVYRISLSGGGADCFDMVFDETGFDEYRHGWLVYDISKSGIDGSAAYTYRLRRDEGAPPWIRAGDGGFLTAGTPYRLRVYDYAGNGARLEFTLSRGSERVSAEGFIAVDNAKKTVLVDSSGRFTLEIPAGAVERRCLLRVAAGEKSFIDGLPGEHPLKKGGADVIGAWRVEPFDRVYEKPAGLSISAPPQKPGSPRALVYGWFPGRNPRPLRTRYDAARGTYTAETRTNGYFLLALDRGLPEVFLPPVQEFISYDGDWVRIRLTAFDELSRLDTGSIKCFFDGEDLPVRYDHDRRRLELALPRESVAAGFHQLSVFCGDYAGNRKVFRTLVKL